MSQIIITAILSLLGVTLGAGLQYYFGRTLEGRKQLALQRSQAYVDYFRAVALIAQHGQSKDNLAMAADAKVRICIYGSLKVIKHLSELTAVGVINSAAGEAATLNLLREMRIDTGVRDGRITELEFKNILIGPAEK